MKLDYSVLIVYVSSLIAFGSQISCSESIKTAGEARTVDLSPKSWKYDFNKYYDQLNVKPSNQSVAKGEHGAVAVGYYGLASRAGLEALRQGGNAIDAALTTSLTQIALDGGYAISYFGVMNLVYYEAKTGKIYTMDAGWNSIRGETDPLGIPGGNPDPFKVGGDTRTPSGRTALVGGFMKGVEAAHGRFGTLPFKELFKPAIYVANEGFVVGEDFGQALSIRRQDLSRLPETKSIFFKQNDSLYGVGDLFRQKALVKLLNSVADQGAGYMYSGPWGDKLVRAIQNDGGVMTMEDLKSYQVIWADPLVQKFEDFEINTLPNNGGLLMIEALNLAKSSGLSKEEHWTKSSKSLQKALTISEATMQFDFMSNERFSKLYPDIDRTDSTRLLQKYADKLWAKIENGKQPHSWRAQDYKSSDVVVTIDAEGNIAVVDHSINTVIFGKTAIVVDGVTISDAAALYRKNISRLIPGSRLKGISKMGIIKQKDQGMLGFASKGGGMHHRSFQGLLNILYHGMSIDEAVNSPDFYLSGRDPKTGELFIRVPAGRFSKELLDGCEWHFQEIPDHEARSNGEGVWIGVSIDGTTKRITAASHTRSNSASVAF